MRAVSNEQKTEPNFPPFHSNILATDGPIVLANRLIDRVRKFVHIIYLVRVQFSMRIRLEPVANKSNDTSTTPTATSFLKSFQSLFNGSPFFPARCIIHTIIYRLYRRIENELVVYACLAFTKNQNKIRMKNIHMMGWERGKRNWWKVICHQLFPYAILYNTQHIRSRSYIRYL